MWAMGQMSDMVVLVLYLWKESPGGFGVCATRLLSVRGSPLVAVRLETFFLASACFARGALRHVSLCMSCILGKVSHGNGKNGKGRGL